MADSNVRIVSLIPSATEILASLGLGESIVGRSHECDYPPEIRNRPICTQARINNNDSSSQIHEQMTNLLLSALSIYELNIDTLKELRPTHIVTQDLCDVCAVSLPQVEAAIAKLIHPSPQIVSLQSNTLGEVWADIERIGRVFNVDAVKVLDNLEARVKICRRKVAGLSVIEKPTVVCIEWTDPLMTAANWVPELVELAGGQTLLSIDGQQSTGISWETLVKNDPDIIIFMPCGLDLQRTQKEAESLSRQHSEWKKLHAVNAGRVFITDGNAYFNRPGPRLVDSLEILAEILHPEIFEYGYQDIGWKSLEIANVLV